MSDDLDHYGFGDKRKDSREERKKRAARDRSKYKKSDRKQRDRSPSKPPEEGLASGRVLAISTEGAIVDLGQGRRALCTLRGSLKQERGLEKNLLAVGDCVQIEEGTIGQGSIAYVEPRRSILSRADNLSRRKQQIIAANIDLVLITASVVDPPLKPFLIDRYIIAACKGRMTPIVLINKVDLLQGGAEEELYEEVCAAYAIASVKTIAVSAATGQGLDELRSLMAGKASVFSGQSGTGKSSLINAVAGAALAVGETVAQTKKGAHTTTMAQLLPLEFGGWCIDTPGIKSFGVWDLTTDEVESYYEEIHEAGRGCQFSDCSHSHEESCAVKDAVDEGAISPLRYSSYLSLKESIEQEHKRR